MEIGLRIVQLRESKGWTTNRLANNCGISQSFLRSVELGEKGISVENLALICDTLEISLRAFFDLPSESDTLEETILRRVSAMTEAQKKTLAAFLATLV